MNNQIKTQLIAIALSLSTIASTGSSIQKRYEQPKEKSIITREDKTFGDINMQHYLDVKNVYLYLNHKVNKNLTEIIEKKFNMQLPTEKRERYNNILMKTLIATKQITDAYEMGNIELFEELYDDFDNKEYICLDDIIEICSLAVNYCFKKDPIENSKKYIIKDNEIIIDRVRIGNSFEKKDTIDYNDPFTLFNLYYKYSISECDEENYDYINKCQVKMFLPDLIENIEIFNDTKNQKLYLYTNSKIEKYVEEKEKQVEQLDIESYNYSEKTKILTVYNKNGYANKINNDDETFKIVRDYDQLKRILKDSRESVFLRGDSSDFLEILKDQEVKKTEKKTYQ